MKLVSCYIENFGGLSQYSMEFSAGLTVIQEPNGFGKTTLAEFIRAMFYGFPRKKGKLGKRQKYRPWSGAKCRGHLTFEHEGRQYRIERTFGATGKGDICKIYDLQTGQETDRFTEEVGVQLFGLDADSFERSTYLPQNQPVDSLTTDSIRAKLGDLVEDANDVGNFEKAMAVLKTRRSTYLPYRGSGGSVAEAAEQITRIQQMLEEAEDSAESLERLAEEKTALKKAQIQTEVEIKAVRGELEIARTAEARQAHRRHEQELTVNLEKNQGALTALLKKYPQGTPDREELETITQAVEGILRLSRQEELQADGRLRQVLEAHGERFEAGIPTDRDFDDMHQLWDDHREVEAQLKACGLSPVDQTELEQLQSFFASGVPNGAELSRRELELEQASRLRLENQRLASQTVAAPGGKKTGTPLVAALLAGGVVGILAGIVMLAMSRVAPGGICLAAGILALLGAAYLNLRTALNRQSPGIPPQVQNLMTQNEREAVDLEAGVRAFAQTYGATLPEIRQRLNRLEVLRQRQELLHQQRNELRQQLEEYDLRLDAFFDAYQFFEGNDPYDRLTRLQRARDGFIQAQEGERQLEGYRRERAVIQDQMTRFRARYGFAPQNQAQLLELREDLNRLERLKATVNDLKIRLETYRRENGVFLSGPAGDDDVDCRLLTLREGELLDRQQQITGQLLGLNQRVKFLTERAEKIPALRDELADWQARKTEDQHRAALLDDTMDFLNRAKDGLATAYMGPIRDSFATLMDRMAGEDRRGILVTPELEVSLEREGASRELAYFSTGQADLVMLCMRLALVDALFREAKPFVILDDPFVNLDDERIRAAQALLEDLSRDRQIIYLVCHSSRAYKN